MAPQTRWPIVWLAVCVGVLSSCASGPDKAAPTKAADNSAASGEQTTGAADPADQTICRADADAVDAPYSPAFPAEWTFPADTTVYDVEDRGSTGVIVTAVSSAPYDAILDFLNTDEQAAGFTFSEGETEDDDAEANWASSDYTGRWTLQRSATCDGETVIQVLATPVG